MRNLPQRKKLRIPEHDYTKPGYYFVTVCTALRGQNILSSIRVGGGLCPAPSPGPADFSHTITIVLTPIGRIVDESICGIPQRYDGVKIDTYCIMPDHVHLILAIEKGAVETRETGRDRARPLQDIIGTMKSFTDRQYRILGMPSETKLWQVSYYDHIIRNQEDLDNARQYIQNNPLRWVLNKLGGIEQDSGAGMI